MTEQNNNQDTNNTNNQAGGAEAAGVPSLSGNDAVNLAAQQSQHTASKNLHNLDALPVAEDTANLRHGPSLHDGLLGVLPLVGVWRGEGQAEHDGEKYNFGQQLMFFHNGENYLQYSSRIWRLDEEGNAAGADEVETGFWRVDEKDNIERVCSSSTGHVEVSYGTIMTERSWEMESASVMVTENGPQTLGAGKFLFGLMPNNDLGWVEERLVDGELKPRRSAQLKRVAG